MLKKIILLIMAVALLVSCKKDAGVGGTASITGKIYIQEYSKATLLPIDGKEYYAPEQDVYIIYGDDEIYSERFRTQYDGSFEFKYLRKGKYKIFTYSDNPTEVSEVEPVIVEVEITEKGQQVELPDIVIKKY